MPSELRYYGQYIATVLLAVFMVTFVPFNLLHRHAEHEHIAALLDHEANPTHHCELDNHFCQADMDDECGHEAHLQETIAKCFSCAFHFIKHFESNQPFPELLMTSTYVGFQKIIPEKKRKAFILKSNKGPPCFDTIA